MPNEIRKHCNGCYRITLPTGRFGQVIRRGREWHAEVRDSDTGVIVRYAGIWNTRQDAIEEIVTQAE